MLKRIVQKARSASRSIWTPRARVSTPTTRVWTPAARRRRAALTDEIRATFPFSKMARAESELAPEAAGALGAIKYFDCSHYLTLNLDRALALGLDRSPRLRVLDLGSGFGYFLYACRFLGHHPVGVYYEDGNYPFAVRCYSRSIATLQLERVLHRITTDPLPAEIGGAFDLVTAYQVCFDDHESDSRWGAEEWRQMLSSLKSFIHRESRLHFELNKPSNGIGVEHDVAEMFSALGARVDDPVVDMENCRALFL